VIELLLSDVISTYLAPANNNRKHVHRKRIERRLSDSSSSSQDDCTESMPQRKRGRASNDSLRSHVSEV
jgi:hypothetical protein